MSTIRLYVDGVEEDSESAIGTMVKTKESFMIGLGTQYFSGDLDEIALYDRALSQSEIESRFPHRWTLLPACAGGSAYADLICDTNPIGYWRLGETSGGTADDNTDIQNGTYVNAVTLGKQGAIAGDNDTAVGLDGSRVDVEYEPYGTHAISRLTIEGWARTTSTSLYNGVIRRSTKLMLDIAGGPPKATVEVNGATHTLTGTSSINDGAWHHFALTHDGSTIRLYVDGVEEDSEVAIGSVVKTTEPLMIGLGTQYFSGDLDEIALYDRALFGTEVADHFNAGN